MKVERDTITLSTGTSFYAYSLRLGLPIDGVYDDHGPFLSYGYDGHVDLDDPWDEEAQRLTPAERREIADAMIARWQEWAARP